MRVLLRSYSNYFDPKTKTQFSPVLDRQTGCYVAVADVSPALAEQFKERPGFELLSDADFLQMTVAPSDPEPTEPETGDPLTDMPKASETSTTPAAKPSKTPAIDAGPPPPPPSG